MTHPPTDLKDSWLENELDRSPYLPLVVIDFRVYAPPSTFFYRVGGRYRWW
jgi:hypothetical protein